MIEIFKDKLGDYDYVCEYRIFSLEDLILFKNFTQIITSGGNNMCYLTLLFTDVN